MNSNNYFEINYDENPPFKADAAHLLFDQIDKYTTDFNQTYNLLTETGTRISIKEKLHYFDTCTNLINSIFDNLKNQTNDEKLKIFLLELEKKSIKLFNDDFEHLTRNLNYKSRARNFELKKSMISNRYLISKIDQKYINKIKEVTKNDISLLWENHKNGKTTRDDLSINGGRSIKKSVKILNKAYKEAGILDAVSYYTGVETVIGGFALELSANNTGWWNNPYGDEFKTPSTSYLHFDETISIPKSILYLTDTTNLNGPTSFIPNCFSHEKLSPIKYIIGRIVGEIGSSKESPLNKEYKLKYHVGLGSSLKRLHFMMLPPELRFNSHLGFDVPPNSELESNLRTLEIFLTGPAGTCVSFDGSKLLHRGGLVKEGHRIALQIIFIKKKNIIQKVINKIKHWSKK